MPTVTVRRSDLFPIGTVVGIYPAAAAPGRADAPRAAAIATGTVDAAGLLTVTNAGILQGVAYVAGAQVGGVWTYVRVRSTLDVSNTGIGSGTGDTTSGSANIANATATSGAFTIGQRLTGQNIPPGARIKGISGSTLTLTDKATATATGVALQAEHAGVWRAVVMRRRDAIGTAND